MVTHNASHQYPDILVTLFGQSTLYSNNSLLRDVGKMLLNLMQTRKFTENVYAVLND